MLAIFVLPLIGAAVVTVLGSIWYGPLFSKAYMQAMGITGPVNMDSARKDMMIRMVIDFLMTFVMLFGFLTLMNLAFAGTYTAALVFASLFWVFIVMPQKASNAIWSGRGKRDSWVLFFLGAGYSLLSFLIVAPLFIWLIKFFI